VYKRVVVPLDGSQVAEGILPFILGIAGPLDLDVVLVRVVQPIPPTVIEGATHVVIDDIEGRMAEAKAYVDGVAQELETKGVRVRVEVRRGEPAAEIVATATGTEADLIAMSTHGRSGLGRLVFGSVAQAVLRQSDIPVLLIRETEAKAARRGTLEAVR
jgi:nucleotide-binding universal stress UspA family protein